jgi:hypothetical protein
VHSPIGLPLLKQHFEYSVKDVPLAKSPKAQLLHFHAITLVKTGTMVDLPVKLRTVNNKQAAVQLQPMTPIQSRYNTMCAIRCNKVEHKVGTSSRNSLSLPYSTPKIQFTLATEVTRSKMPTLCSTLLHRTAECELNKAHAGYVIAKFTYRGPHDVLRPELIVNI